MAQAMFVMAIISMAAKSVQSYQAYQDEKDARQTSDKLSSLNRAAQVAENAERERRMANTQSQQEGLARASAGATGVGISGSILGSLEAMSAENTKQLDWLKSAGSQKLATMDIKTEADRRKSKQRQRGHAFGVMFGFTSEAGGAYDAGRDAGYFDGGAPDTSVNTGWWGNSTTVGNIA